MSELVRCAWPGLADPLYQHYHDTEWGVPQTGERALFEKLCLEGFQAGLSWLTILRKREAFRAAFDGFEPERVARYGEAEIGSLLRDPGIVRSRAKIEAVIGNARAYLAMRNETSLARLVWSFAPDGPMADRGLHGDIPAVTEASTAMAKALKARGFRFVGPTTAYAFMQSVGMVNDHLVSCHRHARCAELQRARGNVG